MELSVTQSKIHEIRGIKVMLDFDLADMNQVETKALKQAVRRNMRRFPPDFMFEVTREEYNILRSHIVTLKDTVENGRGKHSKYEPFAFTEQGVSMLSSVLHSDLAIEINIGTMRAFVALRKYALEYSGLNQKLDNFMLETNMQFNEIYQALTELAEQKKLENKPRRPVGYVQTNYCD